VQSSVNKKQTGRRQQYTHRAVGAPGVAAGTRAHRVCRQTLSTRGSGCAVCVGSEFIRAGRNRSRRMALSRTCGTAARSGLMPTSCATVGYSMRSSSSFTDNGTVVLAPSSSVPLAGVVPAPAESTARMQVRGGSSLSSSVGRVCSVVWRCWDVVSESVLAPVREMDDGWA
jgi:hypothetical protein